MSVLSEARAEAEREFSEAAFRAAVEAEKDRIRARAGRPRWRVFLPFNINIEWTGW